MRIFYHSILVLLFLAIKQDKAETGVCPTGVSCYNGLCNDNGDCQCWEGWTGEECDIAVEQGEIKSRKKRALPTEVTVTEVDFYLNKEPPFENVTDIYPGSRIHFSLTIHLPPATDLLVELFTPDNDTTVMALCDVAITRCGSNILQCPAIMDMKPEMASKSPGDTNYDQAIFNFGILNNSQADTSSYIPNSMVIEWDAVMIPNPDTVDQAEYWISAGAEYASESMIWVGQTSVNAHTTTKPAVPDPVFSITGNDTIQVGTAQLYTIDMHLTFGAEVITFDALSPITGNGEFYVGSAAILSAGKDFDCLNNITDGAVMPTPYPAENYDGYDRVRLDIGMVINKGAYDDYNELPDDNLIQIQFIVCGSDNVTDIGKSQEIGAALEIGSTQIWAGTFNLALDPKTPNNAPLPSPPVISLTATPDTLAVNSPSFIELEVELPENSTTDYTVEFIMPYTNGQARLTVCSAMVTFMGENLPCRKSSVLPVLTSQTSGSTDYDKAVLNLGAITDTGYYNGTIYPDANKLRIKAVASATNHPDNLAQNSADVTVNLIYGSVTATETVTLNFDQAATAYTMTQDQYPDWSIDFKMGDGNVSVGGLSVVDITMTTKPLVYYTNLETEVMIPIVDGDYLYQLCSLEIIHVGKNLGCIDLDAAESTITGHSNFSDGIYDRFTMLLGGVINHRPPTGVLVDPDDDVIRLRTVVRIRDHPLNVNGYKNWLSTGFRFHPNKLWVGQEMINIADPVAINPDDLYVGITRGDEVTNDELYIGKSVRYIVVMKMESMTQGPAIFKVSVAGVSDLKVCALYLVSVGDDVGCGYNTDINATYTVVSDYYNEYEAAELDLGIIGNTGSENMTGNTTVDDATVLVEFVIHLADTATDGSTYTVSVSVDSLGTTVATLDQTITARTNVLGTNTPSSSLPQYNFTQAPIANEVLTDDIIPGESKKFYFDIYFAEKSNNAYNIKFLSPVNYTGALEICGVNVLSVGRNLPCLNRRIFKDKAVYTERISSDYDDIGTLDLGYVCQAPIVNDTEENKIRLEVIARAPRHMTLLPNCPPDGQSIWISATAKINADQIYVTQRSIKVKYDNSTFVSVNSNQSQARMTFEDPSPLSLRPASIQSVRVNITVPLNSKLTANLQVNTQVSQSAEMTIHKISVVQDSAGENLGCFTAFTDLDFFPDYITSGGTSQVTQATLNLGIITNSGLTVRDERYAPGDDSFSVDIELQMADSPVNVLDYAANLTVALTMDKSLMIATRDITVMRNNSEAPQLELSANITNDTITYGESLAVQVEAELRHGQYSSAEARHVYVVFYYPQYLNFSHIAQVNMTEESNHPQPQPLPNGKGVAFYFDHVYFTDVIYWRFILDVTPVEMTEALSVVDATTPYEAYSNMIYRANNVRPDGYYYATPLDYLTYLVQPTVSAGSNVIVLGMESGLIKDCQLQASVGSDPPVNARPTATGWKAANRGPLYQPYFQVNFGNVTRVTEIILTAPSGITLDVPVDSVKYDVYTSNDNYVWTHIELMTGSGVLAAPAIGRHFRMAINKKGLQADAEIWFKVEFKGYYISNDVSSADVCKGPEVWQVDTPPTEMYYRGFLAKGTNMFFCDLVAKGEQNIYDEEVECYKTSDGSTWTVLDKSVFNVIGYDAANDHLYGLCNDKKSYLVSDDMGATWYATSKVHFDAATKVIPKTVPFTRTATFADSVNEPDSNYLDDTGTLAGANFKGMYYFTSSWNQVTDWSSCCMP